MRCILAGLLAACFTVPAQAGLVLGITFSGPGGTGSDGGTFSNVTEPRLAYSAIDYIDLHITVDSAGSYLINEAPGLGYVWNLTGQHWNGLNLLNLTPKLGGFNNDWVDYSSKFSSHVTTAAQVSFSGTPGVAHTEFTALFGTYTTNAAGTFVVREYPTIVPEPATMVLLAVGGLAVFMASRRRTVIRRD